MRTRHITRASRAMERFHTVNDAFIEEIDKAIHELEQTAEAIKNELPTLYDLKKHVSEAGTREAMPAAGFDEKMEDELEKGLSGIVDPQ